MASRFEGLLSEEKGVGIRAAGKEKAVKHAGDLAVIFHGRLQGKHDRDGSGSGQCL